MNLKILSNVDLILRMGKLVQTERKITHLVLECIEEIDRRRLYLEKAYSCLFEFLVKEFGYSPSAANRRIESARLLREVPDVAQKIESGALNLSQLSQVQRAIRAVQKLEDRKVSTEEKRELLNKIENTTQSETELIVAQEFSLPVVVIDKTTTHRDESVTLTITFSKEQMEILKKTQDLIAHSVPDKKWACAITYLAQKEIERRLKIHRVIDLTGKNIRASKKRSANDKMPLQPLKMRPSKTVISPHTRIIPTSPQTPLTSEKPKVSAPQGFRTSLKPNLRKSIFQTSMGCQFTDSVSGKTCGSTRFLQIDHRHPVWAGGANTPENLQVLCAQHNRFKYRKDSGVHPLRW